MKEQTNSNVRFYSSDSVTGASGIPASQSAMIFGVIKHNNYYIISYNKLRNCYFSYQVSGKHENSSSSLILGSSTEYVLGSALHAKDLRPAG